MRVVCILAIFLSFSTAEPISSFLTDAENKSSASLESKKLECYDLSILRQMINQETVLRLALVKNVHALVNDVTLMKQTLAASETKISDLQRTEASLQLENRYLKNSSRMSESRITGLETELRRANENVTNLLDQINAIQRESDDKRREMFNKTKSVVDDIKLELRYLSVTLLDFKESTENENELRDKKHKELELFFNISYEEMKAKIVQNKLDFSTEKAHVQNLEDSHAEMREAFKESLRKAVARIETRLETSEYKHLKLSSAVASLEVGHSNLLKSNSGKSSNVAFSAGISTSNANWTGSILVFPTVIYSEGSGYSTSTGIFTAPTAGTYVFYVTFISALKKYIWFDIVLNGYGKVRSFASNTNINPPAIYQTGNNLVILHLQTSDRVWVQRGGGTGYHSVSTPLTTFSGFKLH